MKRLLAFVAMMAASVSAFAAGGYQLDLSIDGAHHEDKFFIYEVPQYGWIGGAGEATKVVMVPHVRGAIAQVSILNKHSWNSLARMDVTVLADVDAIHAAGGEARYKIIVDGMGIVNSNGVKASSLKFCFYNVEGCIVADGSVFGNGLTQTQIHTILRGITLHLDKYEPWWAFYGIMHVAEGSDVLTAGNY